MDERECGYCFESKPVSDKWRGRRCPECARAARQDHYQRTGKHRPGRLRNYGQRAEIAGVLQGATSWVTCSACRQMRHYRPRPDGKGVGWRSLVCPSCVSEYMAAYRAAKKDKGGKAGPCSKCGQEGEYRHGNRCASCVRKHHAEYMRSRRKAGKGGLVHILAHSKICGKCRQRCRESGQWDGDTCPNCRKSAAKKGRQNLRARMVDAGEWRCTGCNQVQPVDDGGKGWSGQKCPGCQRAHTREYQRRRYNEVLKHDKEFRAKKLQRSRAYEKRRTLRRPSSPAGGGGRCQAGNGPQTPGNAVVVPPGAGNEP